MSTHFAIRPQAATVSAFSPQNHPIARIEGCLIAPDAVIETACLQDFAKITPQYPGLRAPLAPAVIADWAAALSPLLSRVFGEPDGRWTMQAWYSVVSLAPEQLAPIQRLPHVDGTDPRQVAMMLYLHRTGHGGTAFFRHRSTGLEAITAGVWPRYKAALESEIARSGLPPASYVTDGAPHFERTHASDGAFNEAVFYRGNLLHCGVIDNAAALPPDPREGRLTINAFFRPPGA
jgi:hypothetical protein